jgi:hypothetical protein
MPDLPHCDELYIRFFDRWLTDDDRQRKGFKATRPDLMQHDGLIGITEADLSPLMEESRQQVVSQIESMLQAARGDWPPYLNVSGEVDLLWVDAFDRYYDANRIADAIAQSLEDKFTNDYVVLCCEFGAVLAHVMRKLQPRLIWCFDWPCFESSLVDPKSGNMIPVFHWAVKKMSGYGWDDGFAQKVEVCLQVIDGEQ